MKIYILYVLLCINILLLFLFYRNNKIRTEERELQTQKCNKYAMESLLLQNDAISSRQGTYFLSPNMILHSDRGDSVKLADIKREKFMLVVRYSTLCCSTCVDDILSQVKNFIAKNEDIDILLLTTYRTMEDKSTFKRIKKIFPKVYNVFTLNFSIEQDIIPYIFLIDDRFQVIDIFIPRKEFPELTDKYLDIIKERIHRGSISATTI